MNANTLERCKCGDPLLLRPTAYPYCSHCDNPCPVGETRGCPRCKQLNRWEPWKGYTQNKKEGQG